VHAIPRAGTFGLILLIAIILMMLVMGMWMFTRRGDSMVGAIVGLCTVVPVGLLFCWMLWQQGRSSLHVSADSLTLNVPFYGRTIPLSSVHADSIRVLSSEDASEWGFSIRTNGIGLPAYQVGWFRTRAGHKVLAARTTGTHVLIPTDLGYSLIVSSDDPGMLMRDLRGADS